MVKCLDSVGRVWPKKEKIKFLLKKLSENLVI